MKNLPKQTAVLMIKRLLPMPVFGAAGILLVGIMLAPGVAPAQERKFTTRDFQGMPLAVRVRNLQSDTWPKDLEIEVRNVSGKPIYSILAYLVFPDVPVQGGGVSGIHLVFGETKYIDTGKIADAQDSHLSPGDTYIFTIPEKLKKGLKGKHERQPNAMKKLELHFAVVSFGDGTGFEADQPKDRRVKRAHGSRLRFAAATTSAPKCSP